MCPHILLYGKPREFPNYEAALIKAGAVVRFGDGADCDGLLLPGGGDVCPYLYGELGPVGDEARDRAELALIESFLNRKKPIFGICRGMQVINVALGGTLFQDIPGHQKVDGKDHIHLTRAKRAGFLYGLYGKRITVNSAHHQALRHLGEGLVPVQWSMEDEIIEAVEHEKLPIWGVQWHPERLNEGNRYMGTADGMKVIRWFVEQCE